MSIDLKMMRPGKLAGLLNSTRLGEVTSDTRVRRNIVRAGLRVGDSTRVNVLGYAAWLVAAWYARRGPGAAAGLAGYEALRAASAARNRRLSAAGRDIAPLPEVVNPDRRAACEKDFRQFCETYFAETFYMSWSDDHLKVIAKLERTIREGGQFAVAMPRGSGKSVLTEAASLWAILIGARSFVVLIAANETQAAEMLANIKVACETEDLLLADFPEVIYPIRALERLTNRQKGQKYLGNPTYIRWQDKRVQMATIPGSAASGAIITTAGLESSNIRGLRVRTSSGATRRPDLALIDDPQTDETAGSPVECAKRERLLAGAVLGMAGPGRKIAALMPCTVIRPADVADNILDRKKHPEWHGERMKMIYAFPTDAKLWEEYARIFMEDLRADGTEVRAYEFYRANREAMDAGAMVAWPARLCEVEVDAAPDISAIQHAMNLKILRGDEAFFAEYQNEPLLADAKRVATLTPDQIAAKMNGLARGTVPASAARVVAFIDVHKELLYWLALAVDDGFTAAVIDYGTWPDQHRSYFTHRTASRTLGRVYPRAGWESAVQAGLTDLATELAGREWRREDGAVMRLERVLVDANWGEATDLVHEFCRRSPHAALLMPSHGKGIGAYSRPMAEYTNRPGDRAGYHWRLPTVAGKRRFTRYVLIDTNFWKTFAHTRLAVALGDRSTMTLFGRKAPEHRLLADHLTAEYPSRKVGNGRTVDEWMPRPDRGDNHWLDCLVGCCVAASMAGVSLFRGAVPKKVKRKRKHVAYM